jgi:hypothetical protein
VPKAKPTPLTERELAVLSGWFARSNMGQERAGRDEVQRLLTQTHDVSINSATITFCAEFMECDEHERMFEEEADGWYANLKKLKTREKVLASWPDVDWYFWTEPPLFEHESVVYYVIEERGHVTLDPKNQRGRSRSLHKRAALEAWKAQAHGRKVS